MSAFVTNPIVLVASAAAGTFFSFAPTIGVATFTVVF